MFFPVRHIETLHMKLSFRSPASFPLASQSACRQTLWCVFHERLSVVSLRGKAENVPCRKRASTVTGRIIFVLFGTRGVWDGTCSVFSDAPAAPLCAPQTVTQSVATFTALITIRPPASPASFKILRWKHGGVSRACIWAKWASERQRLSAPEWVYDSAKTAASQRAAWTNQPLERGYKRRQAAALSADSHHSTNLLLKGSRYSVRSWCWQQGARVTISLPSLLLFLLRATSSSSSSSLFYRQ